jgi:hypothetical protein
LTAFLELESQISAGALVVLTSQQDFSKLGAAASDVERQVDAKRI